MVLNDIEFVRVTESFPNRRCGPERLSLGCAVRVTWSDGTVRDDEVRWTAWDAGRSCYRFVQLAELCMMVFPADPRCNQHIVEAQGLMDHEPTLSSHLPRCFGRLLKPWQDRCGSWCDIDILLLEWMGPSLTQVLEDMDSFTPSIQEIQEELVQETFQACSVWYKFLQLASACDKVARTATGLEADRRVFTCTKICGVSSFLLLMTGLHLSSLALY